MESFMNRLAVLFCCSGALLCGAEVSGVRTVYVMPMSRGLDQYLVNRLTREHVFQVVTDPKMADAIFTDRIGEGFETQLEALFPPPPETEKEAKPKDKEKDEERTVLPTETVNRLSNPALTSQFGRGKGTLFLVDTKSHQVVWSLFDPPKSSNAQDMDRTASSIVSRLKKDLNPNKK
jgi:hypothetical protein